MDKPISLSVKEYIIRKLSMKVMIPEKIVDVVVSHQFNEALNALSKHNSVEIAGFGKFYFNEKKAKYKMEKFLSQKELFEKMMNDESLSDRKRASAKYKYEEALKNIDDLKPKINEYKTNSGGLEEQLDASQGE